MDRKLNNKFFSLLLLVLIFNGCSEQNKEKSAKPENQLTQVGIFKVNLQETLLQKELSGRTVIALESEIRPQISGIIEKRFFVEGSNVKEGEILYKVVSSSYEATYNQAKAAYKNVLANIKAAQLKDARYEKLLKINAVSKETYEDAHVAYLQAKADVEEKNAAMQSAKINLDYTLIRSPIAGHIGASSVTVGALVTAEQTTALATVRSLDPIFVDFTQPSIEILNLKKLLKQNNITKADANVSLRLEDDSIYKEKGKLKLQELSVDETTNSVTLRAEFPNSENTLLPGMFVNVIINEAINTKAILVPQQGISFDERGNAIATIVNHEKKVEKVTLALDRSIEDFWLVKEGLQPGDHVIIEGLNKIKAGEKVQEVDLSSQFKFNGDK